MDDTAFTINKEQLEVQANRVFATTPERLWQAMTDSDLIPKWWGPSDISTVIEKNEVQVGGGWRYIQTDAEGKEHPFSGEYKEVDEPRKIVRTFEYEPIPGHVLEETMLLEPTSDGKIKLTTIAHYANLEDLEGMVSMGMESGQRQSLERLAVLVSQ